MEKRQITAGLTFVADGAVEWQEVSGSVKRKVMVYDEKVMLVKVAFQQGGIGEVHAHPHVQMTYIESGLFEVEIDTIKQVLKTGDSFYVPSNSLHGVTCLEEGMLIDIFHPSREDFLL